MRRIIVIAICFFVCSCHSDQASQESTLGGFDTMDGKEFISEEMETEPPRTAEPSSPDDHHLEKGTKVIRTGNMSFQVSKLNKAKSQVDSILSSVKGYYENEHYNAYGNRITYSLTLRVPNSKFDSLVQVLETGVGELRSKNISARDVTEEYVDLNIRLDNKLSYLQQYKTILSKAKSIKEILDVQEKIRRLEEEIESKKGRLKYLDDKVKFSTLHLELTETLSKVISNRPSFGLRIANAFKEGIQGFLNFVIAMVHLWPFIILLIVILLFRKRIWAKLRRRS